MSFNFHHYLVILTFIAGASLVYYLYILEDSMGVDTYATFCPVISIITVREGGRLGNIIWEYASTVALGQILNLTPYMPRSILKCLGEVFQNLSVPAYEDTILSDHCRLLHGGIDSHCKTPQVALNAKYFSPWDYMCNTLRNGKVLDHKTARYPSGVLKEMYDNGELSDILILPQWVIHPEAISKLGVKRFQQLFQFHSGVLDLVKKTINGVLKSKKDIRGEVSLVGVHVRRTDYDKYLKRKFGSDSRVGSGYYDRAMAGMRALSPNKTLLFVIVSDDRWWCMKVLVNESSGVFWGGLEGSSFHNQTEIKSSDKMRSHDLALLAALNDSIISYGSFGASGALLAGGHTIAFNLSTTVTDLVPSSVALGRLLENWELMT